MLKKIQNKLKAPITLGLDDYVQSMHDDEKIPPELPPQALNKPQKIYSRPQNKSEETPKEDYFDDYFDKEFDQIPNTPFLTYKYKDEDKDILKSPENDPEEGFYREGSKIKAPSRFPWVRWWKPLSEKEQIVSVAGALTVAFLGLCAGIIMNTGSSENAQSLVLKTSKKTYELGETVKIKESSFVDKKKTDEEILDSVSMYSTLFTDTGKYSYDDVTGVVKSRNKDFLNVGKYTVTLSYKKDGVSKEKDVSIVVKDTKKPEFKNFKNRIYVLQGMSGVDLKDYFAATDKSGMVSISCDDSKVDLKTVGSYTMTVKARDASDNVTKKKCQVHVVSIEDVKNGKVLSKLADGSAPSDATTAVNDSIQTDKNNEIASAESAAREAYNNWQSLVSQANAVQSQITQLQNKKSTEQQNLNILKQKVDYAQSKLDEAEASGEDTNIIDSLKEQLEQAQKNYTTYSGQITDSSEIDQEVSQLNKQLLDLQKKASAAKDNYDNLNNILQQKKAS